jgi:hypothetical protein
VLFGITNPGGRVPISVPRDVGTLPSYYWYKETARVNVYLDEEWQPCYSFGYGLSYTTFATSEFRAWSSGGNEMFGVGDTIFFEVEVANMGDVEGSYVAQVYLLRRMSSVTQPVRKLMAFQKVYLGPKENRVVRMELEVDRYLPILNRKGDWELEKGRYTFGLLEDASPGVNQSVNATLGCV